MSRTIALSFLILSVLIPCCTPLRGEELAVSGVDVSVAEMKEAVADAIEQGFWVSQLAVQVQGNRITFDYALEENADDTPWIIRLNATDAVLLQVEQKFADQSYTRAIEASTEFNGHALSSIVWRKVRLPRPLILPSEPTPESGQANQRTIGVDKAVKTFLKKHNAAGAAVAIGRHGDLVYSRAFGYADVSKRLPMLPDAEMRIASISKSITAAAAMRLVENRQLNLDAKLLPLLTSASFQTSEETDPRWAHISIRHLLEHSGGWDRKLSGDPLFQAGVITRKQKLRRTAVRRDIVEYQLLQPLDFEPGHRQAYSNFGYLLLGIVIESITGQDYEEAIQKLLLRPADMRATRIGRTAAEHRGKREVVYHMQEATIHHPFWEIANRRSHQLVTLVDAPYGQWDVELLGSTAGWVSTASDLVRLMSIVDPPDQFSNSILRRMTEPALCATQPCDKWLGYGWSVTKMESMSDHQVETVQLGTLAGTSSLLFRRPDGLVCCVLFNTDESTHGGLLAELFFPVIYNVLTQTRSWSAVDVFSAKATDTSAN